MFGEYMQGGTTVRKTANTILCYSIAMILLLFGLNLEKAEEIFCTPNSQIESLTAPAYISKVSITKVEGSATKIIGTRSEWQVQQITKETHQNKKDMKAFLYILKTDGVCDHFNSVMVTDVTKPQELYHTVVVLNYIHDLDGKKRA